MRLTLRAMLAYMDNILEPEDAEVIGKKIEESKTATEIMHKIRDSMRRLRVGAPDVDERSQGLDANTVAEYLDHVLHDDRVPDFERVCLESDVQMAEVASSHQILAMVLGEPAEVDVTSRDRMYGLPNVEAAMDKETASEPESKPESKPEPEPESAPDATPAATAVATTDTTPSPRRKPEVPDYLRQGALEEEKQRRWPILIAAVGLVVIVGSAVLSMTGQFAPGTPLGRFFGRSDTEVAQGEIEENPKNASAIGDPEGGNTSPSASADGSSVSEDPDGRLERSGAPSGVDAPAGPAHGQDPSSTAPPIPVEPDALDPNTIESPEVGDVPDLIEQPIVGTVASPAGVQIALANPVAIVPEGGDSETAPLPPESVARLVGSGELLLRFLPEQQVWDRVDPKKGLLAGTMFLSFPTFRPELLVGEQVRARLVGQARGVLSASDEDGVAGLSIHHGRFLLQPVGEGAGEGAGEGEGEGEGAGAGAGEGGTRIRLDVEGRSGTLTFIDAETLVGVEAVRTSGQGDPETRPGPLVVRLHVISGKIHWQGDEMAAPMAIRAPVRLTLDDQPVEAVPIDELPDWLATDAISPLDQRASIQVQRELEAGRPVRLTLRELAVNRQREVRWLALRCLGMIGEFRAMIETLDDENQKAYWPDHVEYLASVAQRDSADAAQVRTAMEQLHDADGVGLYAMLWSYHGELSQPEAIELIDFLEHQNLAFRRLAFWNLKTSTHLGLHYEPEDVETKRKRAVASWRDRLLHSSTSNPLPIGTSPTPGLEESSEDVIVPDSP